MKATALRKVLAVALVIASTAASTLPASARHNFTERNYGGCATEAELYAVLTSAGIQPIRIVKVKQEVVLIRGKGMKTGEIFDFAVLPCQLMIDGRFPVRG